MASTAFRARQPRHSEPVCWNSTVPDRNGGNIAMGPPSQNKPPAYLPGRSTARGGGSENVAPRPVLSRNVSNASSNTNSSSHSNSHSNSNSNVGSSGNNSAKQQATVRVPLGEKTLAPAPPTRTVSDEHSRSGRLPIGRSRTLGQPLQDISNSMCNRRNTELGGAGNQMIKSRLQAPVATIRSAPAPGDVHKVASGLCSGGVVCGPVPRRATEPVLGLADHALSVNSSDDNSLRDFEGMVVRLPSDHDEADLSMEEDAEAAGDYVDSINAQLYAREEEFMVDPNYMKSQAEINSRMRAILIDWLVDVQLKCKMRSDTLFLTVNLIDRYLASRPVQRCKLQLVGVVATLVAAKFEELEPPTIENLVYFTDRAYTADEIRAMECRFLTELNFTTMVPTPAPFLDQLANALEMEALCREMANYLLELAQMEMRLLSFRPSLLTAAAVRLSYELDERNPSWPSLAADLTGYSHKALDELVEVFRGLLLAAPGNTLKAIYRKYSSRSKFGVSTMTHAVAI